MLLQGRDMLAQLGQNGSSLAQSAQAEGHVPAPLRLLLCSHALIFLHEHTRQLGSAEQPVLTASTLLSECVSIPAISLPSLLAYCSAMQ